MTCAGQASRKAQWAQGIDRLPTGGGCVVTGAGGFIGGHLVRALLDRGLVVRAVDAKPLSRWQQVHQCAENVVADLAHRAACERVIGPGAFVFNLAANMGGMGFISRNDVACLGTSEVSLNILRAAAEGGATGYLLASSACVYPAERQSAGRACGLTESEAYPADPPEGYGWEKLFAERMAEAWGVERNLPVRLPRLHNIYGPHGAWRGGREKAPAAITRKVLMAKRVGAASVPIWGDGMQIRSFLFVDDCVEGLLRLAFGSTFQKPINIGSDIGVSIAELFTLVCELAGVTATPKWQSGEPTGVAVRTADITLAESVLGWRPETSFRTGMTILVRELEDLIGAMPLRRIVEAVRSGTWDL